VVIGIEHGRGRFVRTTLGCKPEKSVVKVYTQSSNVTIILATNDSDSSFVLLQKRSVAVEEPPLAPNDKGKRILEESRVRLPSTVFRQVAFKRKPKGGLCISAAIHPMCPFRNELLPLGLSKYSNHGIHASL
jgi:hypothetical protein